jgi:hypothetical protein
MTDDVSQTDRVEAWLRAHGSTTIGDWDRQPACDGGNKITRLARCIGDLRARGVPIPLSTRVKLGNAFVAEYRLATEPRPSSCMEPTDGPLRQAAPAPAHTPPSLGQATFSRPRCALDDDYDYDAAA